jgi:hypothetical protein
LNYFLHNFKNYILTTSTNLVFFYNFFNKYKNLSFNINQFKKYLRLDNFIFVNFSKKQPKINILNVSKKKKFSYSIGLVLKILNLYKKSSRRNFSFVKYLVNYIIQKFFKQVVSTDSTALVIKGFVKNYLKVLYYFKTLINILKISILYINPVRDFSKSIQKKKKKSLKRRLYKKLVEFNNL